MQPAKKKGKGGQLFNWLKHNQIIRFGAVGFINTTIDFSVLFGLVIFFGFPNIVANTISTSVALVTSYALNKRAVFGNTDTHNPRRVLLFIVITLTSLWLLQGIVITLLAPILHIVLSKELSLLGAKLIASFFSLIWNYLWYSRVVFKKVKS